MDDLALLYLAAVQALAVSLAFASESRHPGTRRGGRLSSFRRNPVLLWLQLGTRHILEAMKEAGHDIRTLFLCGGLSKNALFVQIHASATGATASRGQRCDVTNSLQLFSLNTSVCWCLFSGLPVVLPEQKEAVLLGAAMLGACASRDCSSIQVESHTF